jgi:hypothetical protein
VRPDQILFAHLKDKSAAAEINETGKQEENSNGSYAHDLTLCSIDVRDLDSKESLTRIYTIDIPNATTRLAHRCWQQSIIESTGKDQGLGKKI